MNPLAILTLLSMLVEQIQDQARTIEKQRIRILELEQPDPAEPEPEVDDGGR